MKQRTAIIISFVFLIAALVGINAVSYKQKPKVPDSEAYPNRSTYHAGPTGTRALFDLLNETGAKPIRWQSSFSNFSSGKDSPATLVIVGSTRLEIEDEETRSVLEWVQAGGRLVIIDRFPNSDFLKTTGNWTIKNNASTQYVGNVDPWDQGQMTSGIAAVKPSQASVYSYQVNAVQVSRFASSAKLDYGYEDKRNQPELSATPFYSNPPPTPTAAPPPSVETAQSPPTDSPVFVAPFVHLSNGGLNYLVDYPYGMGEIAWLTDPYVVSNGGIGAADNAQLALNFIASRGGVVAFDEYHQGYGANAPNIFNYFEETPVIPIFAQICLLVGLLFWSQSRRFARPLPLAEPNRLSKLEYVSAMAQLQERAKAYDLAIENVYGEFRRSAVKILGKDISVSRKDLAKEIAARTKEDELETYNLMRKCEEIVQGEPTNKRQTLELISALRQIEAKLGVKRARNRKLKR